MRVFGMGLPELALVFSVVLVFFGPKNLPKLGAMMGRGIKKLRDRLDANGYDEVPSSKKTL